MNAEQHNRLTEVFLALETAKGVIEEITGEEQDKFDQMTERSQEGSSGEKLQATIGCLEDASSMIDDAMGSINQAKEN